MPLYLDYNATTPVLPEVRKAMEPYWADDFGNPTSRHIYGQRAKEAVEYARKQVADVVDCKPSEVIFTSGATESNNLALLGLARHPSNAGKKHIISSPIEHKSVLEPLAHLRSQGYEIEYASMDRSGRVKANEIAAKVRPDTLVVSIMHVNNETGIIQPIEEICDRLADHTVYFHTDAAQGFAKHISPLKNQRIDLISVSGHKIHGPKGIGALIRRRRRIGSIPISPLMYGGGQERGIRPGTLSTPLIVGLGEACNICKNLYSDNDYTIYNNIVDMASKLSIKINGDKKYSLKNAINITIQGLNSEALITTTKNIFCISLGSACNTNNNLPSHVLLAMGLTSSEIHSSVRLSWSPHFTDKKCVSIIRDSIGHLNTITQ